MSDLRKGTFQLVESPEGGAVCSRFPDLRAVTHTGWALVIKLSLSHFAPVSNPSSIFLYVTPAKLIGSLSWLWWCLKCVGILGVSRHSATDWGFWVHYHIL